MRESRKKRRQAKHRLNCQAEENKMNNLAISNSSIKSLPKPENLLFGQIINGWECIYPLKLNIEQDDNLFIVSDDIFGVYGDGNNEHIALTDYKISLIDYYQLIEANSISNKYNQNLLKHLKVYIKKTID